MDPAFETAAFDNPVGLIATPVQSSFGWHVIEILDKKMETPDEARQRALTDWLTQQAASPTVVTKYDTWWKSQVPAAPVFDTQTPPTAYPTSAP